MVLNDGYVFVGDSQWALNGCCSQRQVMLVQNIQSGLYSCQCACGRWITQGFERPDEAIDEYKRMSEEWYATHKEPCTGDN